MNRKYIPYLLTMLFIGLITGNAFGQKKQQLQKKVTIESVVTDENGNPIPHVLVSGKEGAVEVTSDANGKFSIEIPENSKLLFEAKGYDQLILPATPAPAKVMLKKIEFLMDASSTVNIAFGKIKKREVVGAVSTVNTRDISKFDNSQDIYDAIRGRVPGLMGSNIIRGIGDAIFIVDGVPRDPSNINIEEIDQISVLKDANSAVLWGAQAKNGVIIVTTKRGQAYKRKINVTAEQGFSSPISLPKYLSSDQYLTLYNEALVNDGLPPAYADSTIAHYTSGTNPYRYPSVDYYSSDFLRKTKPFSKVLTEFSGGNDNTQYYAAVGWIHSGSLYELGSGRQAKADRFNIRGNVDFKVNDFISSYVDALVIIDGDKGPLGNFWSNAATLHPEYFSPLLPVSMISSKATMKGGANLGTAERVNGDFILGGTSQYTNNAYGNMLFAGYNQNIRRTARFNAGVNIDLKFVTEGLKLKTFASLDVYNAYIQIVNNSYAVYQPTWSSFGSQDSITTLNKIGTDVSTGVQNLGDGGFYRRFGSYAMLDYARTKGLHSVTGTLLGYFDTYVTNGVTIDRKNSHLGLRLTYDYNKKFFVDFSSALVNGFKMKEGKKGGFSPSLGLAWVLRDEQNKPDLSEFNYLKLRASAGIIDYEFPGTNYRLYESTYGQGSTFSWGDQARTLGVRQTLISRADNPNLSFEKMKTLNVGMEGYFFNNLVYLEANVFATRNSGIVVQRSIYGSYVGNNIPYENYNINDFRGGEAGIKFSKNVGDFYFDLGANILISSSNVVKRDELWSNAYQYRQGKPYDAIFGLEAIGLFQDQADISASPVQKFGEVKPGDIKYKDQNGDNKIDADDEIQIGNALPKFCYGLNFTLQYKGISLFAIGNGYNGAEGMYGGAYFWVQANDKYSEQVLNRWTPATASTATYPRLSSKSSPNNFRSSTYWLYANNLFNLDRVQLNVDLPKVLVQKIASKEMTIYLRGENLARLSKDAEKRQLNIGFEPRYTSYALGLKILF